MGITGLTDRLSFDRYYRTHNPPLVDRFRCFSLEDAWKDLAGDFVAVGAIFRIFVK